MKLTTQVVRGTMNVKFHTGTMDRARAAADAGATVDEVKSILENGFISKEISRTEVVTISPVKALTDHPLAGAM